METILPTSYVFNNKNVVTTDKMYVKSRDRVPQRCLILLNIAFIGFLCLISPLVYLFSRLAGFDDFGSKADVIFFLVTGILLSIVITIDFIFYNQSPWERPYKANCQFRLIPESNLIVLQDKSNYPEHENEPRSYPYRLYVKDANKANGLSYLGKIKNKQIMLNADTKAGDAFTSYYYYAQKHHLTDKFKQKLYFVKDPNVTDINGVPQYVLKGDGITLKMKFNKNATYQIYEEKA